MSTPGFGRFTARHLRRDGAPQVSNRIYLAWRDGAIPTARALAVRAALLT